MTPKIYRHLDSVKDKEANLRKFLYEKETAVDPLADDLLLGAQQIAEFVFGDSSKQRKVYPLREELGLFYVGGQLAGLKSALTARMAEKAAAAAEPADAA